MMSKRPLDQKEIISLLSKLKDQTPEYPADLLDARKAAFLKQAATLDIPGKGQGGEGGQGSGTSGSGGSGTALGGGTAAQGFVLQALIGFSIIAAMLLTAFAYREQISEILRENNEVTAEQPLGPSVGPTLSPVATPSPRVTVSSTQAVPTGTTTAALNTINLNELNGTPGIESTVGIEAILNNSKTNPGLHLGQTPGTPAAPGQGNPGNINQPDKPDKPDKPNKPDKPDKPDNPNKPPKTK